MKIVKHFANKTYLSVMKLGGGDTFVGVRHTHTHRDDNTEFMPDDGEVSA